MPRLLRILLFAPALVVLNLSALAQSDENPLDIFGYFQSGVDFSHETPSGKTMNTFLLHQMNVFASKSFGSSFSSFLDIELTDTYSSDRNWGTLSIEEGWVKYHLSDAFNIKAGLLIPTFNNLNEIKNRTPLIPYIFRPLVYEAVASEFFGMEDFIPQRAFFQVYGALGAGPWKFDYAAYIGNSESPFINSSRGAALYPRGADTTTFKLVGARVGMRANHLKAGVSMTVDKDDQASLGLGPVHRVRVGADLSAQVAGWSFEAEVISVDEQLSETQQLQLTMISQMDPRVGNSLDKVFYYGTLNYDFSDQIFAYISYQYMRDEADYIRNDGFIAYTAGVGFRPIESIVIKGQYLKLKTYATTNLEFSQEHILFAVSVFF